jgi:hypothetical protein
MAASPSSSPLTGLRPVFIVGHPRSGTTLMQQVLSVHKEIWSVPETFWFSHILPPEPNWDIRQISPEMLNGIIERLREKSIISLSEATQANLREAAQNGELSEAALLNAVMQDQKIEEDAAAERWLEKTPYHVYHLPKLWRMFPDALIIGVMRDPRDVISSRVKRKKPGPNRDMRVFRNSKSWNRAIEALEAQRDNPQFLHIRYEDFITDPQQVLNKMASHIQIEPDVTALDRFTDSFAHITINKGSDSKVLNNTQALVDQRGVWRERLNPDEIRMIEIMCQETMSRHGYVPEQPVEPGARAQIEAQFASRRRIKPQRPRPLYRRVIDRLKRLNAKS